MSIVVVEIHIAAPPQRVWDYVMDPGRAHEWVTIVRGTGTYDDGPLRAGFHMDQTLCLRGVKFKVHWTLEEADAPNYARWEGVGPARSKAVIEERVTAANGGSTLYYRNEFKSPLGPLGAAASWALVGGIPEKEANASLRRLKAILESE